ncbi:hypothetical protein AKJ13_23015 [Methylobacterium sp. ARG-1]|nr:hypothetical protein AKJ13_23015 [Methylobacterium sp. ARG-1]
MPKGACGKLRDADVADIRRLAELRPTNRVFERHQRLQAGRSLFKARSDVLVAGAAASIPDRAGTSAVLPRRCDVAVALSVDYDVGSGLTFAIGYKLVLAMPTERRTPTTGDWYPTRREYGQHRVMLVESKSVDEERNVFMDVMARLVTEMQDAGRRVREAYAGLGKADYVPTTQVYLWDRLNFDHLRRVMGRHLLALLAAPAGADRAAPAPMAWFFPPESVIEDPDFTSRNSPVTIVAEAVRALVAANVPHHYSLLNIANEFHPSWTKPTKDGGPHFRVSRLFVDPLSDQIPSERGHEVWNRRSPFPTADWQEYRDSLKRVVRTRLDAVLSVVDRLVEDLRADLAADAPALDAVLGGTKLQGAMSRDSEILYQHARLMAAAAALENDLHMAMPPHQREASFESVRLTGLLEGADRAAALEALGRADLATAADILVFTVSERSRQAKIKAGTFDWSLMPEDALKLQYTKIPTLKRRNPALERLLGPPEGWESRVTVRQSCQVDVVAVDRVGGTVAVRARSPFIGAMRQTGLFDLDVDGKTRFAILDPLVVDYFVKKRLRPALRGIATPPLSLDRPLFRDRVLTRLRMGRRGPNRTRPVPAERFVWDADALSREPSGDDATPALAAIAATGRSLTPKQADAVRQSIERRLSLLWGPPGTGKSTTAVALLYGLLWEARRSGRAIRVAITGPTWVAIDTVAKKVPGLLAELGMEADVGIARLATTPPAPDGIAPELVDHLVLTDYGVDHVGLIERLSDASRSTVVAATATQLAKLTDEDHPLRPFFDFMLVDEASQMSVAHGMVAYTTLADGASLTVVGDNLQMPPIQPVAPPEGAKHLVGSLYDFYHRYREGEAGASGVVPVQLDVSFRSNKEIVEFVRLAGYRDRLEAAFPDLRMRLVPGAHNRLGGEGSATVDAFLDRVLDPGLPLVAVIHQDEFSSQRNDPEAQMVATMVWALRGSLLPEKGDTPLSPEDFYRHGIGVVTPHRAQQAAVVERLMQVAETKAEREALLSAVDTVERFQGQEKTVMVASFGLGDVDQIAAEEEFLYSLNRFNVVASRAKAKLVVILSRKLVDYLPRTPETLRESRLLKHYADGHLPSLGRVSWPELGECDLRGR